MQLDRWQTIAPMAVMALLLPLTATAQDSWLADSAVQARLAQGQVVTQTRLDHEHARADVDAAIRIHAAPAAIWELLTNCQFASVYIPGLKHCKRLDGAADGSWAIVEHDIKYSALLPMVHSIFRAEYQRPRRIDFHRVAGDLKDEVGSWVLQQSAGGIVTVEYNVSIEPGFWVPLSLVRHSLEKKLPASLEALRAHAEQSSTATAIRATR